MDEKLENWYCWNCSEHNYAIKLETEKYYCCQSCGTPKDTTATLIRE